MPDDDRHRIMTKIRAVCRMNTKEKQLFRMDTKVSCLELFGTTRNVRLKADIIIKRREVGQQIRIDTGIQNGGFWLSMGLAAGYENGISFAQKGIPGHL